MVDLKGIYEKVYSAIHWPAPIPSPKEISLRWNGRLSRARARCWPTRNFIEFNTVYRDLRLQQEVERVMIHEAAHFIWPRHSKEFRGFLRNIGVSDDCSSLEAQLLWPETCAVSQHWRCSECRGGLLTISCRRLKRVYCQFCRSRMTSFTDDANVS